MTGPGTAEPSLQDIGLAVKRLQWRHHRQANQRLAGLGLSLAQWDVLRHLHENPDASLHALAVLAFQTDQSMGALASRMIAHGLLARADGPGRAVRHVITAQGEQLRAAGARVMDGVLADSVGVLSGAEQAALLDLLTRASGQPESPPVRPGGGRSQ